MAINSRRKGLSYERELVAQFRNRGWIRACRNIETNPDAILGLDLLHTEPFSIQAKRLADYAPISRIFEIPPLSGQIPVLITKPDGAQPAMAVLPLHDLLRIISPETNGRPTMDDF